MILNERLKSIRLEKGFSQETLARMIDISSRNYQRFERDGGVPAYRNLLALANVLDVSVDWLMGRTDRRDVNR